MLIHLLDPLDTDRQSSDLDKKMLPCIVKQSNEYLYRIMPFWRRYCLCVWMAWGALRTQENGSLRALNFKFSWGSMSPNPPSLVGANHSRKILDPPLHRIHYQTRFDNNRSALSQTMRTVCQPIRACSQDLGNPAGAWNTISDGVKQTSLFRVQQRK